MIEKAFTSLCIVFEVIIVVRNCSTRHLSRSGFKLLLPYALLPRGLFFFSSLAFSIFNYNNYQNKRVCCRRLILWSTCWPVKKESENAVNCRMFRLLTMDSVWVSSSRPKLAFVIIELGGRAGKMERSCVPGYYRQFLR